MLKTSALILKKQNFGETDRILTILTPTLGKKRVIVKAVRKPLSKMAGHLDTMMLTQLILTDSENLPKVTSATLINSYEQIRENLPMLDRAYSITRLVERVVLEDVDERPIFQLTIDSLSNLNDDQNWEMIWLHFIAKLTSRLGLEPTEFLCKICQEDLRNGCQWQTDNHYFVCNTCPNQLDSINVRANAVKLLKLLGKTPYATVSRLRMDKETAQEVEELYLRLITDWLNKSWRDFSSFR